MVLSSEAMRSGLYVRPKSARLTGTSASSWISPAAAETVASKEEGAGAAADGQAAGHPDAAAGGLHAVDGVGDVRAAGDVEDLG